MCVDSSTSRHDAEYTRGVKDGERGHDPEFRGPAASRSCTDVLCCIVFLVFIMGLVVIGGWSYIFGDYRRIILPKDSQGKVCGVDYPDKPKLVFFDLLQCFKMGRNITHFGCPTPQVCVEKCPNYDWSPSAREDGRHLMICRGGVSATHPNYAAKTISQLVKDEDCAPHIKPSQSILGRCVPTMLNKSVVVMLPDDKNSVLRAASPEDFTRLSNFVFDAPTVFSRVVLDLSRSWQIILLCFLVAAVISFLWICLMRLCVSLMVYITLIAFILLFGSSAGYCFYRYHVIKTQGLDPGNFYFTLDMTAYFRYATTWLWLGILATVLFVLITLMVIFLRKRIQLAIVVLGETSKAVANIPSTLLWPIVPFVLIFGVIVLLIFVDVNLRSIAIAEGVKFANASTEPKKFTREWMQWALHHAIPCDPTANTTAGEICYFVRYGGSKYIWVLQIYNFAACLWLVNFFIALGEITLAGAFSSYYFSRRDPSRLMPTCPLLVSLGRALLYHMGSVALGSLLITLLGLIRAFLLYLEKKLKSAENPVAKGVLRCLGCCFWCLEKFLRFLNRNAYIIIAIYGYGFCRAAKDAFGLILRNVVRVFVVDKVTDFVLFVGKLVVCGFSGAVAYFFLDSSFTSKYLGALASIQPPHLYYFIVPVLIIVIGSYLIAKAFFSVYEMGVDTIFLCFCEDLERNDGSAQKPYFMSTSMMKALGKTPTGDH
uniref:Choline transporter-like protein n=2 Tax=Schistocephalus solidus TaxID=70667 RepID=A0A0X3NM78_SCHSO